MNSSVDGSTLATGTVVGGDFVVERALASGGMGSVYVVRQHSTQRLRALKVLATALLGDEKTRESFMREAQVGARIQSMHVVEVIAAGIDQRLGVPWLVMELLNGFDLRDQMEKGGGLAFDQAMRALREVFHAISAAHQAGIVHRDLKPENLFLHRPHNAGEELTTKVLDFGIAKVMSTAASAKLTRNIGTPGWMAPEQCNSSTVTPATDVWSLGLVVFFALTGQDFWISERTAPGNMQALLVEMLVEPIPAASTRAAQLGVANRLPRCLDPWFARCLDRDPMRRFQHAGEAWAGLNAALSSNQAALAQTIQASSPMVPSVRTEISQPIIASQSGGTVPATYGTLRGLYNTPQSPPAPIEMLPATRRKKSAALAAVIVGAAVFGVVIGVAGWTGVFSSGRASAPKASGSAVAAALSQSASISAPFVQTRGDATSSALSVAIPSGAIMLNGSSTSIAAFEMDLHEATVDEWKACVAKGDCTGQVDKVVSGGMTPEQVSYWSGYCNHARQRRGNFPVNCTSHKQASAFCASEGKRLPTAPEWLYAAYQAGSAAPRKYPWGDTAPTGRNLNVCGIECAGEVGLPPKPQSPFLPGFDDGERESAAVGTFAEGNTPLGLQDMAGNVWEWTSTPGDSAGQYAVLGGGWFDRDPTQITIGRTRESVTGDVQSTAVGFRCVR